MASSTPASDRIVSLDVLRGFALLGILIMNIQHFSMPSAGYMNPTAFGNLEGANLWAWWWSHVLASNKFMTLFSILFGAGVLLFSERAGQRADNSAALHYRRMFWLLLFGLMHAYLLWAGDILVNYALCGMLAFLFRRKSVRTLLVVAGILFLVPVLLILISGWTMPFWPEESLQQIMAVWAPGAEELSRQIAVYRSGWSGQMELRIVESLMIQTTAFFSGTLWRVTALMLLGMALMKTGVLTAQRSRRWYVILIILSFVPGILLVVSGVHYCFVHQWDISCMFQGSHFNYFGSLGMALGYLALIMLLCKGRGASGLKRVLGNVGRMAFSNYILMTLIGTLIFYGHGLGRYGMVERAALLLYMLGIWALVILFTQLWMRHFRMGPLEALWRSLTYRKRQPLSGPAPPGSGSNAG